MDLQKVYDSIWREELRFKQEKVGIKRMFLDINSMYTLWTFFAYLQKSGHEITLQLQFSNKEAYWVQYFLIYI